MDFSEKSGGQLLKGNRHSAKSGMSNDKAQMDVKGQVIVTIIGCAADPVMSWAT